MNIKYPPLDERAFLTKYLELTNILLPEDQRLIPSEIDLVIEFALLPEDKFAYQRFGSLAKDKVIESAAQRNWSLSKLNINNKLYALLDKQFLRRDEDKVIYMPKHLLAALKQFQKEKKFDVNVAFTYVNEN